MNRTIPMILITFLLMSLTACTLRHDRMIKKIAEMENEVRKTIIEDTTRTKDLLEAYQKFATKYSRDSLAPEYLFRAAGLALNSNRTMQALDLYKSVLDKYPSSVKAPISLFMQAFVFENYLRNFGKANQLYNEFIARYPTHGFKDDAQNALLYMGKSADDMIDDFEAKNQTDSMNHVVN